MSEVKVNKISPRSGTTITLGDSGDTFTVPSGVTFDASSGGLAGTLTTAAQPNITSVGTLTSFTSTGIDDNATSTAITIDSSDNVIINSGSLSLVGTNTKMSASSNGNDIVFSFNGTNKARLNNGGLFSAGDGSAVVPGYRFFDDADTGMFRPSSNNLAFSTGNTERMRIDSSGFVFVGQTSRQYNEEGVSLNPSGYSHFTSSGGYPILLNRKTNDGEIIRLYRDTTQVGNIGANSSSLYIAGTSKGFRFTASQLKPCNTSGANDDGNYDLGSSSTRFKDLYLSGGLYVGGTGSDNRLDDYEEGNWTPTLNSGTCTVTTAKYTKIGNQCTLHFRVTNFSDSSSATDIQITGMPFAQPSNTETGVGSAYGERSNVNKPTVDINSNIIRFRNGFGVSTFDTPLQYSNINDGADFDIIATVTYQTS